MQDFADEKLTLEKFCCRFKTAEVAQEFYDAFQKGKLIARDAAEKSKKVRKSFAAIRLNNN